MYSCKSYLLNEIVMDADEVMDILTTAILLVNLFKFFQVIF